MGQSARHRSTSARSSFRRATYRPAGSAQRPWLASPLIAQPECRSSRVLSPIPSSEPSGLRLTAAWGGVLAPSGQSKRRPNSGCRLGHVKSRPAPVFFVSSGALLAGVVEQPLRDVLPDRVAAIQSDCIGGLDFDCPLAATAGDAQHVTLDFRKTSQPYLGPVARGARVFEYRFPVFGREGRIRSR